MLSDCGIDHSQKMTFGLVPNRSLSMTLPWPTSLNAQPFYVVACDGIDPLSGRERRRWHHAGRSRADAESISQLFDRHLARTDIPRIRFHDLRHTHASLLVSAGTPIKVVSERLGHAHPGFTMATYQHLVPGMSLTALLGRHARDVMPVIVRRPAWAEAEWSCRCWTRDYVSRYLCGLHRVGHNAPVPMMPLALAARRPFSCAQRVAVARVEVPILV